MLGPTISLLPISLVLLLLLDAAVETADDDVEVLPVIGCAIRDAAAALGGVTLAPPNGEFGVFVSRLPKRVSERSMGSPDEDEAAARSCTNKYGNGHFNVMGNLLITPKQH
jgi:hypothetical protein